MSKPDFAFIVHSRDRSDLPRRFPILKVLPNNIFDILTKKLPPFVVSRITGLKTITGKDSVGLLIGIPMTAHQLVENKKLALKKIISAIHLAESKGAKYIGLGAMTASLSKGGKDVIAHAPNVIITTGRTYTVKNITDYIFYCMNLFKLNKEDLVIGVVGAAGGIGSGVVKMLSKAGFKRFILVDLERKLENVKSRTILFEKEITDLDIKISHQVSVVSSCDIIVAATSAPEVVIKSEDVNPGTIIINDAQPSDISPEIVKTRRDVLVIEGGVLYASGINCNFNMGLQNKNEIFSCLAETLLLTYRNSPSHYSVNDFEVNFLHELAEDGKKLNFSINKLQNSLGYISDDFIDKFSYSIMNRKSKKQLWTQ